MTRYEVTVPVAAATPDRAKRLVVEALGFDEHSINDIGGVRVELVPDEKQYLVCNGCGEAFDNITAAYEHGVYIPGPDNSWCGEEGFVIAPESEAL
jgi:hypothetical protein